MATLIARISDDKLRQYDETNHTVIYESGEPKLYGILSPNENCVFICPNFILIGEYHSETVNQNIQFHNIRKLNITNKELLRLSAYKPEENSRTKASFFGYVQPSHIDISFLERQCIDQHFITYNIVKANALPQAINNLNENDRVITIDQDNRLIDLFTVQNRSLTLLNLGGEYFNARGSSLNELIALINSLKEPRPNLIKSINRIKRALETNSSFVFKGFSEYYNIVHNKSLYSNDPPNSGGIEGQGDEENDDQNNLPLNMALNTILYGPPGTGKTFQSIDSALLIINGELDPNRIDNKREFNRLQKEGRIFFTTFHQNMSYEDFIEGIKPIEPKEDDTYLQYHIQDGLFMKACIEATYDYIRSNLPQNEQENQIRTFNQLYNQLFEHVENEGEISLETLNGGSVLATVTEQGNFSVKHNNGTRNYTVSKSRLEPLFNAFEDLNEVNNIHQEFRDIIGGCNSTAFWAVLNAIKNLQPEENNNIQYINLSYEDKKNIVKSFWKNSDYTPIDEDLSNPFVFIIDEINRGNIAQIFGELITLIEEDKRLGKKEEIRLELPYSKQTFCVPPNLFIIGTMNTADRSVEALDTALRRRFSFIPMMPIYDELNEACDEVNLKLLLKKLNDRLTVLKDRDHTIGHAWLWDTTTIDSLRLAFKDKIIPLLQEFFYNDYEKLGLLLGDRFIQTEVTVNNNLFAPFERGSGLRNQYANKVVYKITEPSSWTSEAFQSIYENLEN